MAMAKKPTTALLMHPVVMDELFRDDHLQQLSRTCDLVSPDPYRSLDSMALQLPNIEILITSWGCPRIGPELVTAAPRLKLIAHLAGSVKGFIDEEIWRNGIKVINTSAANAVPVAEYTLATILMANKKILKLANLYKRHKENRAPWTQDAPNAGNYRKTVGIIGASHIGRLVIEYLQPFEMDVLLYDPYLEPIAARRLGAQKVGLAELLSKSDIVSVHVPLLKETRNMLAARELALMQDGATLINTARGAVVDPDALLAELQSGRLNAVLDTTEPEELPPSSPLFQLPNVMLTPHIAGSLGQETQRLTDFLLAELERYAKGKPLQHLVKREDLPRLA